jgi:hypothetical protein
MKIKSVLGPVVIKLCKAYFVSKHVVIFYSEWASNENRIVRITITDSTRTQRRQFKQTLISIADCVHNELL